MPGLRTGADRRAGIADPSDSASALRFSEDLLLIFEVVEAEDKARAIVPELRTSSLPPSGRSPSENRPAWRVRTAWFVDAAFPLPKGFCRCVADPSPGPVNPRTRV
jgi:hypothetical protein